jgi:two-component system, NtrC family, response regulator HydG
VNPNQGTVVVADDDRDMANLVCDVLRQAGYNALSANSGSEALEIVKREIPDALISDLRMSGMNGHQLQAELKRLIPDLPVTIITAFGSIQSAVDAMKLGAFDYITKPFGNDELLLVLARALENRRLRQEIKRLRGELARSYGLTNIIAANQKMAAVLDKLEQVADSSASVLIIGESGTGKDLLARALHFESRRRDAPFVPINCAAIPEKSDRKRAIRPRAWRIHRRPAKQDWAVRGSGRRHGVSRRDRRYAIDAAGQAAANYRRQEGAAARSNR